MKAVVTGVRISPRKVQIIADAVRSMQAKQAIQALGFVQKHGARILAKVIQSAVANAVTNNKVTEEVLVIDRLVVNAGPFLKRFRPSTRGRVHPYKKRSTHITVVLKEKEAKK